MTFFLISFKTKSSIRYLYIGRISCTVHKRPIDSLISFDLILYINLIFVCFYINPLTKKAYLKYFLIQTKNNSLINLSLE